MSQSETVGLSAPSCSTIRANTLQAKLSRRELLAASLLVGTCKTFGSDPFVRAVGAAEVNSADKSLARTRIKGLLLGSMIGDAVGGPVEFQKNEDVVDIVPNCRGWRDDRQLTPADLRQFATSLRLHSYESYRPEAEPYGQWRSAAPPGTVTDDTRQKMILISALQKAADERRLPISELDLATAYLEFPKSKPIASRPEYRELCDESFREFWKSARWVLGSRDPTVAAPPERIWGGVPTCCGQMALLPLAAIYAGRPAEAYRAAFALSFMDTGSAKDINSALVAGLSVALRQTAPTNQRSAKLAWQAISHAMRATDPYRYAEVPYVPRPTTVWLDFAHQAVQRSGRKPKRLFEILEQEGQVKYFWEAHFVLALVFAGIEFCDYDPLAAMMLTLDFGHDTDSAAQLLGAFIGALYGPGVFPKHLQRPVVGQLAEDYDVSVDRWTDLLLSLGDQRRYPEVVEIE